MADQIDLRELDRRLIRLEKQLEQIAAQLAARLDDWGPVKAAAGKVEGLVEELRVLKRSAGRSPRAEEDPIPSAPVVTTRLDDAAIGRIVEVVLARLREKKGLPTMEEMTAEVTRQLRGIDLTALARKLLDDVTVGGIEERLARLLREAMQREVDAKTVRGLIVDALIKGFDLEAYRAELIQALAAKIAESLDVSKRRNY